MSVTAALVAASYSTSLIEQSVPYVPARMGRRMTRRLIRTCTVDVTPVLAALPVAWCSAEHPMDGGYADSAGPGRTPLELASGWSLHCMRGCQNKKTALLSSMISLATSADPDQM